MGGGSITKVAKDPLALVTGGLAPSIASVTGTANTLKGEFYDKPKDAAKDIEREIQQQEAEVRRTEDEYKREQTAEKKKQRDLALQNLQRSQARLKAGGQAGGGYGGTVLTSPLGVAGNTNPATVQKTLLGY